MAQPSSRRWICRFASPGRGGFPGPERRRSTDDPRSGMLDIRAADSARQYTADSQTLNRRVEVEATNTLIDDLQDKPHNAEQCHIRDQIEAARKSLFSGQFLDFDSSGGVPFRMVTQNHQTAPASPIATLSKLPHRQPPKGDEPELFIRLARELDEKTEDGITHHKRRGDVSIACDFSRFSTSTKSPAVSGLQEALHRILRWMPRLSVPRERSSPRARAIRGRQARR